jgi:hypothetical protein
MVSNINNNNVADMFIINTNDMLLSIEEHVQYGIMIVNVALLAGILSILI